MRISDWSSDVCSSDLNGSAIILLLRVVYIGGNAKGPDLIGRTQVEQAIGGLARQAYGAAIDGIGVARFMIELGEQGIIGAQRQAAVVARRDAPFTADIDAVLGRPHQASVREICRGRRRRTRGIGEDRKSTR